MAGIDQLVNDRVDTYSGNEQALQQRYAQNQDLMDLLALQKLKSQQEAAGREMQMQAQNNPDTIKQQMEAEMVKRNKDELLQRVGPTMQRQAAREQKQMQEAPQRAQQAQQGLASLQQQMQQQPPQQFSDGGQVAGEGIPQSVGPEEEVARIVKRFKDEGFTKEQALERVQQALSSQGGEGGAEFIAQFDREWDGGETPQGDDLEALMGELQQQGAPEGVMPEAMTEELSEPQMPQQFNAGGDVNREPDLRRKPFGGNPLDRNTVTDAEMRALEDAGFKSKSNLKYNLPEEDWQDEMVKLGLSPQRFDVGRNSVLAEPDVSRDARDFVAGIIGDKGEPLASPAVDNAVNPATTKTDPNTTEIKTGIEAAAAPAPITTNDIEYKGADYSGIAGNVQGFLGGFGMGAGQLPDAEKQRAIGEKRAEEMTGRKEKTASMQKLIDRYEKVLNEQQDAGKSKREQINAFLRGGAGQSSMGMALASGSSSLAQTRENQEAQVRTGVRELIKANRDLAVFDSEMAKTTLENGMTYFQEAKNDSRAAAEMASRMTNQQMQNANIQAQQEYNAMSDNEKRRLDAEIANGNRSIRQAELDFAQKSQTKHDRLMQYATLARQAGAINSERADRIQGILEKDLEYKKAVVQFKGASAELKKAMDKGESAEKQAKIKQDIATARFDMDRRGDSANLNALNIQNVSGQLALQSRVMAAMDTILPEANLEILTDKASDRGVMQGLSSNASTFLERSRTESLGGL